MNKAFIEFVNLCPRSPEFISLAMDHYLRGAKAGKQADAAATTEEQVPSAVQGVWCVCVCARARV